MRFACHAVPAGFNLLSFWQWSSSDLVSNALRGVLAEYIVASAVGSCDGTRKEWDAFDVETPSGIKVEVKSGAYIQSWAQAKPSSIQFTIRPTFCWDVASNSYSSSQKRQADVYVFCVLAHKDKTTIDPLNLNQWEFYCVATDMLNKSLGSQKTISLSRLLKLKPRKVQFEELNDVIQQVNEVPI